MGLNANNLKIFLDECVEIEGIFATFIERSTTKSTISGRRMRNRCMGVDAEPRCGRAVVALIESCRGGEFVWLAGSGQAKYRCVAGKATTHS